MFPKHFSLTLPQKKPWRLITVPSGCNRRLTSMLHSKRCGMDFFSCHPPKRLHRLDLIAQVLQMAVNTRQPPRCQGSHTFPLDLFRACACWTSGNQLDTYQEAVRRTAPLFHWEDICSRGGQRPPEQQVGQARILTGKNLATYAKQEPPPTCI